MFINRVRQRLTRYDIATVLLHANSLQDDRLLVHRNGGMRAPAVERVPLDDYINWQPSRRKETEKTTETPHEHNDSKSRSESGSTGSRSFSNDSVIAQIVATARASLNSWRRRKVSRTPSGPSALVAVPTPTNYAPYYSSSVDMASVSDDEITTASEPRNRAYSRQPQRRPASSIDSTGSDVNFELSTVDLRKRTYSRQPRRRPSSSSSTDSIESSMSNLELSSVDLRKHESRRRPRRPPTYSMDSEDSVTDLELSTVDLRSAHHSGRRRPPLHVTHSLPEMHTRDQAPASTTMTTSTRAAHRPDREHRQRPDVFVGVALPPTQSPSAHELLSISYIKQYK